VKIVEIQTIPVDRYLFVQVMTDKGITGLGESGAWGYLEASEQAVQTFKRYLIGQDPPSNRAPLAVSVSVESFSWRRDHGCAQRH